MVLVDARGQGTAEHAGFDEIAAAGGVGQAYIFNAEFWMYHVGIKSSEARAESMVVLQNAGFSGLPCTPPFRSIPPTPIGLTCKHMPCHTHPAAASGPLRDTSVYIYGYGRVDEAPSPRSHPGLCSVAGVLRPGDTLCLGPRAAATGSDAASGGSSSTVSVAHCQD